MKTLLKCSLLFALIIGGKIAKQAPPTAVAAQPPAPATSEMVFVHQVLTSEPVPAAYLDYAKLRKPAPTAASAF